MAVFTPVSREQAGAWLERFDLGTLLSLRGIASGIENSNFFVDTGRGRFVLTLFERLSEADLPFYLGLMKHLATHMIPCPDPVADRDGRLFGRLNGKPAALVTRLPGAADMHPGPAQCREVGSLLARMHLAARDYPGRLPNPRGIDWWRQAAVEVRPHLDPAQRALLDDELAEQLAFTRSRADRPLPASAVHADLFRDNVLFDGEVLGGVIDFYFAGVDSWMFDLAVTVNDWCIDDGDGELRDDRLAAMLDAYRAVREPGDDEADAWPMMLRAAALRFWLSRLHDLHLPRPAQMVAPKDPTHCERVLRSRRRTRVVLR